MNSFFIEPEINISNNKRNPASYIRKVIIIKKQIQQAKAIFSACGIYKAYINGFLDTTRVLRRIPINFDAKELNDKIFLVTGTGKYFKMSNSILKRT